VVSAEEVRRRARVAGTTIGTIVALDWVTKALAHAVGYQPLVLHHADVGTPPQLLLALVMILSAHTTLRSAEMNPAFLTGWAIGVGGALGNFGELAAFGHVTNFIHLPILQADTWYASPADLAIWGGSALLALGCLVMVAQMGRQALWQRS
jgi:lipoprotein signal peptidase